MAKNTSKNALESNKKARAAYDATHYTRLGFKVTNEYYQAFSDFCESIGKTKVDTLREAINLLAKELGKQPLS